MKASECIKLMWEQYPGTPTNYHQKTKIWNILGKLWGFITKDYFK